VAVQDLLREGLGVSVLTDYMVREDIGQGRLVRLLPDWSLPSGGIHAVYPASRHVPAKVRVLVDFLKPAEAGRRPGARQRRG
jgi:DNA-binding transcriptional LysR family regulator